MIRFIKPVRLSAARGVVANIYADIRHEFGTLGEPLTLHSPIPELLAGVWSAFRECFLAGQVRRDLKEAVAVTVSRLNRCPFCVDAHTVMLRAAGAHSPANAIQYGRDDAIADERTRAVVAWSAATRSRGHPALQSPPFSPQDEPEFVGAAVWVHYINRMVQAFLGGSLLPERAGIPGVRRAAELFGGWYFSRFVRRKCRPPSRYATPPAALPDDMSWAAASPPVGRAFAAFAAAAGAAGEACLHPEVRACVLEHLGRWDGADPGLGSEWLLAPMKLFPDDLTPAARLALLAAFAPYRIDDNVVREYRSRGASDEALLGCVAWSSFSAARTIGAWLRGDRRDSRAPLFV